MAEFSIEKIKEMLAPLYYEKGLQLVLLFGSIANEKGNRESDIDIGFLFEKPVDILDLTNRVIQLLKTDNVDVVDLCHASPLLRFSAIRKGKLLYEQRPGIFNAFQSLTFRIYVDTKKLRKTQEKAIQQFLIERKLI